MKKTTTYRVHPTRISKKERKRIKEMQLIEEEEKRKLDEWWSIGAEDNIKKEEKEAKKLDKKARKVENERIINEEIKEYSKK